MRINIIGAGVGHERGYKAKGFKLGINYWNHALDALIDIHAASHPFHDKLASHRANAELAGCKLITPETFNMKWAMDLTETDYHSCSLTWAILWAVLNRYEEIHLWGCGMDDRGDHYEKRAGVDYWVGYANALGVKVVVHGNSTICTTEDGLTYGTFEPMKRRGYGCK